MEMHSEAQVKVRFAGGKWCRPWGIICTVLALLVVWKVVSVATFNPTDYGVWKEDWTSVQHCLEVSAFPCQQVSKFPLAYLLNAGLAGLLQNRDHSVLALVNAIMLLMPAMVAVWLYGRRSIGFAVGPYMVALLISPLPLFYILSGALEVQSAVFSGIYLGLFVQLLSAPKLQLSRTAQVVICMSGFMFPLYKDTLVAFLGLVCLILLVVRWQVLKNFASDEEGRRLLLRAAMLAALPVLVSALVSAGYNVFRYGTLLPMAYVEEASQTSPSLLKSAEFLFGSFFSPNGGVLIFWGLPLLLALFGWRLHGYRPQREVLIGGAALVVVSALAFSRWWAPFGWDGWGNRLLLPSVLAALIASLMNLRPVGPDRIGASTNLPLALACVPLLICSAYYIAVPYVGRPGDAMHSSLWPGRQCERMQQALPDEALAQGQAFWKGDIYYNCARERMLHVPAPK